MIVSQSDHFRGNRMTSTAPNTVTENISNIFNFLSGTRFHVQIAKFMKGLIVSVLIYQINVNVKTLFLSVSVTVFFLAEV